jgi:hypothetical protein
VEVLSESTTTSGLMVCTKWSGSAWHAVVARWLVVEFEKSPQAAGHVAPLKALWVLKQQRE